LESHLKGEPNKVENAFDAEPCDVGKIKFHNRNIVKSHTLPPKDDDQG
jgi:hypothetical protein